MQAESPNGEMYKSQIYNDPEQLKRDKEKEEAAGNKVSIGQLLKKGEGCTFHGIDWACFHSDQITGFIRLRVLPNAGQTFEDLDKSKFILKGAEVIIDTLKYDCIYDDPRSGVAHLKIKKPKE